jgi:hypothetical protein
LFARFRYVLILGEPLLAGTMIIDLSFASGDIRIRTRSTPALRHAVELATAILELGTDGHLMVRSGGDCLPQVEFDAHYTPTEAISELIRWTTHFETEQGLAMLSRQIARDAMFPDAHRKKLIERIAPLLAR